MGEIRYMISEAARQVQVESHVLRYWEEELGLEIGRTEMGHRYYTKDDIQLFLCIQKLKNEGMLLRDLKPLIPELTETRKKRNAAKMQQEASKTVDMPSSKAGDKSIDGTVAEAKHSLSSSGTAQAKHTSPSDSAAQKEHTLSSNSTAQAKKYTPSSDSNAQAKKYTSSSGSNAQAKKYTPSPGTPALKEYPDASVPALSEAEVIPVTQLEQVRSLIGDVLTEVVTTNNDVLKRDISKKVTADVIREMDFLFQANERREEEHYRKLDCLIRQQQTNRREAARNTPIGKLKKLLT
ncbi:MAG: MerR family transcriptional regulator [Ruminococcus sp.]|nr:MerR family transcriptional regulator [Ruminococcus sp.]